MFKYVLIIWIGTIDNFADYSEFNTLKQCEEKKAQVQRALDQAQSEFKLTCRVRFTTEKGKNE